MQSFTRAIYLIFGLGLIAAATVALVRPGLALPPEAMSGLTAHLIREQAAGFVFIGAMMLWCRRHYDARGPVHFALLLFTAIFGGIHWMGVFGGHWSVASLVVNTTPAVLFAITAPWKAKS